jgi:peptidylprolyl isomerase
VADGFDPKAEAKTMAVAQTKVRSTTADVPVKLPGIQAGAVLVENTRATGQKTDNLIASFLIHKRTLNLTLTFDPADKSARQTAYGILTSARAADGVNRTKDGFTIEDLRVGDGPEAKAGQHVTVHYRGTLADGAVFDESYKRGQPFGFDLGAGQVIKGWDQGVAGMKVGGRRKLVIPPALAYGDAGAGGVIPPKSTLTFVVELLDVN